LESIPGPLKSLRIQALELTIYGGWEPNRNRVVIKLTSRDGIFKLLKGPAINFKESIPPAYVAGAVPEPKFFNFNGAKGIH
jgi:hypothetical protein